MCVCVCVPECEFICTKKLDLTIKLWTLVKEKNFNAACRPGGRKEVKNSKSLTDILKKNSNNRSSARDCTGMGTVSGVCAGLGM